MSVTDEPLRLDAPARLEAVRATGLNESTSDPALDRLTRLVCSALRVPVALISIVENDRQFFASHCGLSEPLATERQTPLSHSFCKYVVHHAQPLVVPDALAHPILRDSPAVSERNVVAYAGVPLKDEQGHVLGSLCAVDERPREWSEADIQLLRDLAVQVMVELRLRTDAELLYQSLRRLKDVDADRRELVRVTVHDLRTPLSGLLMSVDLLPRLGPVNEPQAATLAICKRNAKALRDMINDMMDIESVEQSGRLSLNVREVDVQAVVAAGLEEARSAAAEKGITLVGPPADDREPACWVKVDVDKTTRVLANLLSNAIKFTAEGGRIVVTTSMVEESGATMARVAVTDSGLRVAVDDAAAASEERARIVARRWGGLALTFCKRVVAAHGGRIWFESGKDGSTTFAFTLPTTCGRAPA